MTDKETLELCIETVLNSPEDIVGRHKQIKAKLDDDGWKTLLAFARTSCSARTSTSPLGCPRQATVIQKAMISR